MRNTAQEAGWPRIRDTRPADLPCLASIIRRTMPMDYAGIIPASVMASRVAEMIMAVKARWPLALTAEAGGEVAGVALVRDGMHLSLLWLDLRFRCQGVGARLLEAVEERVRSGGHGRMTLTVYRDNAAAVRFYDRRGWTVAREYVGRVDKVMLEMEKYM